MIGDQATSLPANPGVCQGLFEGGSGEPGEDRPHASVGECQNGREHDGIRLGSDQHVVGGKARPSNRIAPWLRSRWPSLSRGRPRSTPGPSSSTSATPPPAGPNAGSTVQNRRACVAMVPFETHAAFSPEITHSSPSATARQVPASAGR